MAHYIAIFIENDLDKWRVVFPDMPGCEANGLSLENAGFGAATALGRCIQESGAPAPLPMDLAAVQQCDWLKHNGVDLSKAVVTMVSLAA
jgi:predicted RNase H-like HicB family nuclease